MDSASGACPSRASPGRSGGRSSEFSRRIPLMIGVLAILVLCSRLRCAPASRRHRSIYGSPPRSTGRLALAAMAQTPAASLGLGCRRGHGPVRRALRPGRGAGFIDTVLQTGSAARDLDQIVSQLMWFAAGSAHMPQCRTRLRTSPKLALLGRKRPLKVTSAFLRSTDLTQQPGDFAVVPILLQSRQTGPAAQSLIWRRWILESS